MSEGDIAAGKDKVAEKTGSLNVMSETDLSAHDVIDKEVPTFPVGGNEDAELPPSVVVPGSVNLKGADVGEEEKGEEEELTFNEWRQKVLAETEKGKDGK